MLIFATIFILGAAAGYFLLRQMEIDTHMRMLHSMVQIVEKDFETMPSGLFQKRIEEIRRDSHVRITVIDKDGKVIFESNRNPDGMDNHASRPEIMFARDHGWGSSIRHSYTLDTDLLYVAHRLDGHTVRMAISIRQINKQLISLWLKALLFLAAVMGMLFWWSSRLGIRIDRDTQLIQSSLDRLIAKDYSLKYEHAECCLEFAQIAEKIAKVAKRLSKRERQKAKYTRKLKILTRSQNDIISAISHEFKNPVAAIMGYAQSLSETDDIDPQIQKRFLGKIETNAQKISNMIDRLSLSIKLENRSLGISKSQFDLQHIAQNIQEVLSHKYPKRDIILDCNPATVYADRDLMEHVVMNLTENAIKYSEDEVVIHCSRDRFEVRDHGSGIEPDEINKITDKFYRTDGMSWNNSLGLGLYIVQYILKLHNTKLDIKSTGREGSVFGFELNALEEN
jgi:signal transduction histidine kinase